MELKTEGAAALSNVPSGKRERMAFYEEAMRDPKNHGALAMELAYLRAQVDAKPAPAKIEVRAVIEAAMARGLRFVSRSHGQCTTDTVSLDSLVEIVREASMPQQEAVVEAEKPVPVADVGREFYEALRAADLGSHPDDWDGLSRLWKKTYTLAAQRFLDACGALPSVHTLPALRLIAAAKAVCDHRYGSGAPFSGIYEELKYAAEELTTGLPGTTPAALTFEQKAAMHEVVSNAGKYTSGLLPAMWAAAHAAGHPKGDPEHLKNALAIVTGWLEQARAGTLHTLPYMTNGVFANDLESLREVLAEHVGGAA